MDGETIITWSWPNFITVGVISVLMLAVFGFVAAAASRLAPSNG